MFEKFKQKAKEKVVESAKKEATTFVLDAVPILLPMILVPCLLSKHGEVVESNPAPQSLPQGITININLNGLKG